jgi:hypothetical protein
MDGTATLTMLTRLPGGLPVWRGWWMARGQDSKGSRARPAVAPVDNRHHPGLAALVNDAAKRAGLDPPTAVTLGGASRVEMHCDLLIIGLPLVWGLSADELSAVVAHELALPPTRYRRLTRRLLAQGVPSVVAAAEQVRDAAAIDALGGGFAAVEDAALALFRAAAIDDAFRFFLRTAGRPVIEGKSTAIADLHAGWREHLLHLGPPGTGWTPDIPHERIPAQHPGLTTELRDVADGVEGYRNGLHPAAVPIDSIPDDQQRELARRALGADSEHWARFADLPPTVYRGTVEAVARKHVEAVESVIGGPPADRDDLVDVLLRRAAEVARAEGLPPDPDPLAGASMVADILEYILMRKGWRRRHPVVPWRMVGPDGAAVNLDALRSQPRELRRLLND